MVYHIIIITIVLFRVNQIKVRKTTQWQEREEFSVSAVVLLILKKCRIQSLNNINGATTKRHTEKKHEKGTCVNKHEHLGRFNLCKSS